MITRIVHRSTTRHALLPSLLLLQKESLPSLLSLHSPSIMVNSLSTQSDSPMTPYQSAILHLNSLQSNAAVIQKMREKRDIIQETNVADTIAFLERIDIRPDDVTRLNVIHVSGTKGKGSTCAFVESILRHLGYKTGLYTSPHLVHARERIRLSSLPIDENLFAQHFFAVYDKLCQTAHSSSDSAPSPDAPLPPISALPAYFKFLTLMSLRVFLEEKVDVAVMEVGIGGQYDCTNCIRQPVVCGVTTLDIDHTSMLGSTIEEIAWHKAGIFKEGVPAVTSTNAESAMDVLRKRAVEKQSSLSLAPPFSSYKWPSTLHAGIAGVHQKTNISLALQLVRIWLRKTGNEAPHFDDVTENPWEPGMPFDVPPQFVTAIENCRWPGRSQVVQTDDGIRYHLDGAHTPKSMQMCSEWFSTEMMTSPKRRRILVFQCTADRSPSTLLPYLKCHSFDVALFSPTVLHLSQDQRNDLSNYNQSTVDQLSRSQVCADTWAEMTGGETHIFDCVTSLVAWIDANKGAESVDVLVTGSLHLVGAVLSIIKPDFE